MSIHFLRGYLYGCYSTGTVGFERHQRAIIGDFGAVPEFRPRLLDNVGIDVGKAGSVGGVCSVQLPFDKNGKEQKCATRKT
jgi:hypothetical protein